ncbi:MAG TPA: LysR family transcriptional regulator [Bdellovibrionales bacterium]|nr:LysR family transcriptional regulator [Bdellovibrionales bacterium]
MINFNHLYYFYTIMIEGGLQGASRRLNVTQPALSIQLKALEGVIGKRLFVREHRRLTPTPAAIFLFNNARALFETASEAVAALKSSGPQADEIVRVGVVPTLHAGVVHGIVKPIWSAGHYVTIVRDSLNKLLTRAARGRIDIIVTDVAPRGLLGEFEVMGPRARKLIVAGAERFRKLSAGFPRSLNGVPFITFSEANPLRIDLDAYFKSKRISPLYRGEVDDFSVLPLILEDGAAVGVLSDVAAEPSVKKSRLFKVGDLPRIGSEVYLLVERRVSAPLRRDLRKAFQEKI